MSVARRIRDLRYIKGWGPNELAGRAGISRTALYQIESGKTETPRAGTLNQIARALGVPIEHLIIREDAEPTDPATDRVHPRRSSRGPWTQEPRNQAAPQSPLDRKFRELLASPLGDGVARLVEQAHQSLDATSPMVESERPQRPAHPTARVGLGRRVVSR
jgi:transcriptional regulator with XRE-family HTH domain